MAIGNEKVRRYEPRMIGIEDRPHEAGMYADLHGHYVLHSAYAELAAELRDEKLVSQEWFDRAYAAEAERDALRTAGLYTANRLAEAESQLAEMRATLQGIADADYRKWDDGLNTPFAFVDWAKSRAKHAIGATNKGQDNG